MVIMYKPHQFISYILDIGTQINFLFAQSNTNIALGYKANNNIPILSGKLHSSLDSTLFSVLIMKCKILVHIFYLSMLPVSFQNCI